MNKPIVISGRRWALCIHTQSYPLFHIWHYGDYYNTHTGFCVFGVSINFEYV
jgi:hypothetical protein